MHFPDPVFMAVPYFIALVFLEQLLGRINAKARYEAADTFASLTMGLGNFLSGVLFAGTWSALYATLYQNRLFDIGYSWQAMIFAFMAYDFSYYWIHRFGHRIRWMWAAHVIHHSSQHYNLSTALRQTWTGKLSLGVIFSVPWAYVGVDPKLLAFSAGLNLVYQFWIHTEVIDRMGPLEWVFNTPSHHRVHHATNPEYLDSNYAGALIIWDRLFGTFAEERKENPPKYGIISNLGTFNPLKIATHEYVSIFKDMAQTKGIGNKLKLLIMPPGWQPNGQGMTTDIIKAYHQKQQETVDRTVTEKTAAAE